MAGLGVRIYTDEDVFEQLADSLRAHGYDAVSAYEVGRSGAAISDEEQLAFAASERRAILTFNRNNFLRLDTAWKCLGRQHAGIIVSHQIRDFGELLRRLERHLNSYPPAVQDNTLLWLDSGSPR